MEKKIISNNTDKYEFVDEKVKKFHQIRRMFAMRDGILYLAPKNVMFMAVR